MSTVTGHARISSTVGGCEVIAAPPVQDVTGAAGSHPAASSVHALGRHDAARTALGFMSEGFRAAVDGLVTGDLVTPHAIREKVLREGCADPQLAPEGLPTWLTCRYRSCGAEVTGNGRPLPDVGSRSP